MNILSQKCHRYGGRHLGFILTLLEVFIGCLIQNIFSANQIHKTTTYGFMDFIGSPSCAMLVGRNHMFAKQDFFERFSCAQYSAATVLYLLNHKWPINDDRHISYAVKV